MMLVRFIVLSLILTQAVSALKCHVCKNLADPTCLEVNSNDGRFLTDCPEESTHCGLEVIPGKIYSKVHRNCVTKDWVCKNGCHECDSNGCNHGMKIKEAPKSPGVTVTTMDLIQANIFSICAILFVTGLLVIWCLIRCCMKDEIEYEDDGDEEVEGDEEYDFEYEESMEKSL